MFYRNSIEELREWANRGNRKPLILRGARQVGKTTIVNQFSREFDLFLTLNLEKSIDASLFERATTLDELVTAIYLHNNKPRKKGSTLLFIDEIQNSPAAVSWLRYFYEEAPELHVIAAGSLLESLIDKSISFPVGRVEYLALRPASFNEFLGALGEEELKESHANGEIPQPLHEKVMDLFNSYTLIGGMPEIVAHYAANRDLVALRPIYESLMVGYMDDIEKYSTSSSMQSVLRHILSTGWSYAARRITFEKFANSPYRSREMGDAFRALEKTMLLELVYPTTSTKLPLTRELRRAPKLLWFDTGLVNYSAGLQKELFGVVDIKSAWRGAIAEQIVGQELLTQDSRYSYRRHFWVRDSRGSTAEVDFLYQHLERVIPLEVKSGSNNKLRSLHQFMEEAPHTTAIRFWNQPRSTDKVYTPSGKEFTLYNLPYYYSGVLERVI